MVTIETNTRKNKKREKTFLKVLIVQYIYASHFPLFFFFLILYDPHFVKNQKTKRSVFVDGQDLDEIQMKSKWSLQSSLNLFGNQVFYRARAI